MYEDIKKNKIKSGIVVCGFILMVTLIIYFVCMAFDLGVFSIIFALIFSIVSAYITYYNSDKIILSMNHARPATHDEDQKLVNILDTLMISAGFTYKPKLYVIEDSQPNAFATGRNPENSIICVTTGLLEKLNYYELEGVLAHEMAHIKNYDIRLSAVVTVMLGLIVMLSDMFSRWFFRSSKKDNDKGNGILMLIGFVLLIFAPIFGQLMQLAISRRREYLADATAIEFTRNPDGLISALKKLDTDTDELEVANSSTAHMYIVCPLKDKKKKSSSLFSTHPSISDRINAIKNLK